LTFFVARLEFAVDLLVLAFLVPRCEFAIDVRQYPRMVHCLTRGHAPAWILLEETAD
jgi:hypothetical protein